MTMDKRKTIIALVASVDGGRGVFDSVVELLILLVASMKSIHGTSVATRPRAVCEVVHGTSSTFFSIKAASDICVIMKVNKILTVVVEAAFMTPVRL